MGRSQAVARRLREVALPMLLAAAVTLGGCVHTAPAPDIRVDDAHVGGSIVAFNADETLLASGGWEGNVRLYALPGGEHAGGWKAHDDSVNGLAFLRSGDVLSAGYDGKVVRWSSGGSALHTVNTVPVTHLVVSEDADRLVSGHNDGSVRLWRLSDLAILAERSPHGRAVRAVAYDPVHARIASSSSDGSVALWPVDGQPVQLPRPPTDAWSLTFAPDGSALYGGGWFDLFRWDVGARTLTVLDTEHRGIIKSLDFNREGTALASISRQTDSAVYFLDPASGAVRERFQSHDLCGGYIRLSQGGRYLATTADDASVRVWRLSSARDDSGGAR